VPTYCAAVHWPPLSWKLAHRLLQPWETFSTILFCYTFFCFRVKSPYGTAGRTDRRTSGQDPQCGLLWLPHNNVASILSHHTVIIKWHCVNSLDVFDVVSKQNADCNAAPVDVAKQSSASRLGLRRNTQMTTLKRHWHGKKARRNWGRDQLPVRYAWLWQSLCLVQTTPDYRIGQDHSL